MSLDGGVHDGARGGTPNEVKSDELESANSKDGILDGEDGGVKELFPKHFLPGESETLKGDLIEERHEALGRVMDLCPAAILIPLRDCPQIAAGTCSAVAEVMCELDKSGNELNGVTDEFANPETSEEAFTPFSDTLCPDAEKRQADYAILKIRNNPSIPWVFDSFDKSQR